MAASGEETRTDTGQGRVQGDISALTWAWCFTAHGEYLSSFPVIPHHPHGLCRVGAVTPVLWFMALNCRDFKWRLESQGWWQIWDRKVVVSLGTEIPEQPPPPSLSPPDHVLDFWTKGYPPSIPQIFLPQSCCQDIEGAGAKRRAHASTQTFQSLTQKLWYFPERKSLNRSGGKSLLLPHHHTSAASRQTDGVTSALLDSYVAQSPGFSKPTCTYNSSLMNQLGLQEPTLDEPLANEESDLMDWCFAGLIDEADMSSTVFWPLIWAIAWAGRAYTLSVHFPLPKLWSLCRLLTLL